MIGFGSLKHIVVLLQYVRYYNTVNIGIQCNVEEGLL